MPDQTKPIRCIRLLRAFQNRGELATRDVMRLLDCDRQTARRDVTTLEEAGIPLRVEGEGQHRRYVLAETFRRRGATFGLGDAFALHFGRQLLGFLEGTALTEWLDHLHDEIEPALRPDAAEVEQRLEQRLVYLSEPWRPYEDHEDVLDTVITALLRDRELSIEYAGRSVKTFAPARPLALVVYRRALYLLTGVEGYDRPLRLALDRMVGAEVLDSRFTYPRDFEPREELQRVFGITDMGREASRVRLRFDVAVARLVRSRRWHPTQEIIELADGGVELRMHTSGRELVRLALEFGDKVEVLEPDWLREAVIEELRGALAHYGISSGEGG